VQSETTSRAVPRFNPPSREPLVQNSTAFFFGWPAAGRHAATVLAPAKKNPFRRQVKSDRAAADRQCLNRHSIIPITLAANLAAGIRGGRYARSAFPNGQSKSFFGPPCA